MATRGGHAAAARRDAEPFILPAEGVTVLLRALASGHPQVAVSTRDLAAIERTNREIAKLTEPSAPARDPAPHRYERADLSTPYVAPEPGAERALADLWEEILKIAPIGVDDNFFALGGDSLLAVRILSRMREIGFTLSAKELFLSPTIRSVARASKRIEPEPSPTVVEARSANGRGLPAQVEDTYALTPMQRFMVREGRKPSAHRSYLVQSTLDLVGALDPAQLAAALDGTLAVHPALRTAFFDEAGGEPLQAVIGGAQVPIAALDWSGLDPDEREARTIRLLAEDRARGFDPGVAPLMRVHLIQLRGGARAIFSFHQAMMDGWSSQLVFQDLFAGLLGVPVADRLAALGSARFGDHLAWIERQDAERARAHFRRELEGAPRARLLSALEREDRVVGEVYGTLTASLDAERSARLSAAARDARVTVNTAVQGAWARVLGKIGGAQEVVFGVTVSGRPDHLPHVGSVVGQFTSVLPLRVRVAGEITAGWLQGIQAQNLAMREHALLAPDDLEETAHESLLVFENVPMADPSAAKAAGLRFEVRSGAWIEGWHFPLRVFVFPGSEIGVRISYDRARYDDERVARALDALLDELRK
jgi:aryl carrier-like protein